jgi:hypothetical protein
MMGYCHNQHDIRLIRGDSYELWVGLAQGWDEIASDPAAYEGRLVLRQAHDDALTPDLALLSELQPGTDPRFPDMLYQLHFTASPAVTGALPAQSSLVYFCEVRSLDDDLVRRLFEGKAYLHD